MRSIITGVGLLILTLSCHCSIETAHADVPDSETSAAATNSFTFPTAWEEQRDPLWPVGYVPPALQVETNVVVVQKSAQELLAERAVWPSLKLKALTKDRQGNYMAVIDGIGVVMTGEIARIQSGDIIYRWHIDAIGPQGLKAKRLPLKAVRQN